MSKGCIEITEPLYDYVLRSSLREPPLLAELRGETAKLPMHQMQIAPDQGQFMGLLIEMLGARQAIEVGTFTGYSSLVVALAMPADGKIIACDLSLEYTAIARRYWARAGVAHKIDLKLAPALETLAELISAGRSDSFDFAFIDADKNNYDSYYEAVLKLLRPGGMVAIDNVLWNGTVIETDKNDEDTVAIRKLNAKLKDDARVTLSMVPIGDGLTLARKR
ncbi:MAG: class I SAM-dependent methyltransferase [Dongiaceae bacterium]